jgi:serine protease Do
MMKALPILMASAIIGTTPAPSVNAPEPIHRNIDITTCDAGIFCGGSYLGVMVYDVNEEKKAELSLNQDDGALIDRVIDGSPAAKAGLQSKDVIVGWNGEHVAGIMQLIKLVKDAPAGRVIRLEVVRNGSPMMLDATIGKRMCDDEQFSFFIPDLDSASEVHIEALRKRIDKLGSRWDSIDQGANHIMIVRMGRPKLGVELQGLTPGLEKYFGSESGTGALISNVLPGMPAEKGGLQSGDIIISIDNEKIAGANDVRRVIRDKQGIIEVKVMRDKSERTIPVDLGGGTPRNNMDQPTNAPSTIQNPGIE